MPSKKVHFTANPFIGIDESLTLTFYELDNLDNGENQSSTQSEKTVKDITKFKYLDLENDNRKESGYPMDPLITI
ncbi:unnamed protein product [Parnassius apollo]|uniref:(apollo) hypothetical protein n=1 Tax=Parnassius apollo TaxID=110799 RepID=A0A8S3W618_PARAO|nr:unnamed protein product [Parnassius apollo]